MVLGCFRIKILSCAVLLSATIGSVNGDWLAQDQCSETCSESCDKIIFGADLLVWRPYERGLSHCAFNDITNTVLADGTVLTVLEDTGHSANFKWNPGFRVGAGYQFGNSSWKYGLIWTHFDSKSHSGDEIKIKWNLHFDTVDGLAGYTCSLNDSFFLTAFGGVRVARIDQSLHLDTPLLTFFNHDKEEFCGAGPLVGLEAKYTMGCNFSLYANMAVSWLYGRYHVHFSDFNLFASGSTLSNQKKNFNSNQYVTDAGLGIQWIYPIFTGNLFVRLGLEHHQYFDYNYLENGDLSLSGGILSLGLEF